MFAVIALQILLVTDVLICTQQIGMVIVGFLMILRWFVIMDYLAHSIDKLSNSVLLHVLAELYIGYPVWAFLLRRWLRHDISPLLSLQVPFCLLLLFYTSPFWPECPIGISIAPSRPAVIKS